MLFITACAALPASEWLARDGDTASTLAAADRKIRLAIQSIDLLVVYDMAFAPEQHMQAPIPKALALRGQFPETALKHRIAMLLRRPVAQC